MGIFDDLRLKYKTGQLTVKFIFINVALFLVVRLTDVFCTLLGVPFSLTPYLELPSDPMLLLYRPYTVFTYMFFQYDLLHLLFNMLWLYWFGQLFLLFFNAKQFGGVYILGGLSGAAVYLFAYNLLPYFVPSKACYSVHRPPYWQLSLLSRPMLPTTKYGYCSSGISR